jgi:hypothetical protein
MDRLSPSAKVKSELLNLREFEIQLATQNPYDNRNSKKFLVRVYETQEEIIRLCRGSRPRAKRMVDSWFKEEPFKNKEGRGPRSPTGRSKTLFAAILAATSRAPSRLQSRWCRALMFIDWQHANDLNGPKLEWVLEDHGGIRKLASRAACAMPIRRRRKYGAGRF